MLEVYDAFLFLIMIKFNDLGFLIPATKISSDKTELQQEFVQKIFSPRRKYLHACYLKYSSALKSACGGIALKQWINGSFVSTRNEPGDIDLVTFVDTSVVASHGEQLNKFKFPESLYLFHVDAYLIEVFPPEDEDAFLTQSDSAYWYNLFTRTKRDRNGRKQPKGFLELFFKFVQ